MHGWSETGSYYTIIRSILGLYRAYVVIYPQQSDIKRKRTSTINWQLGMYFFFNRDCCRDFGLGSLRQGLSGYSMYYSLNSYPRSKP